MKRSILTGSLIVMTLAQSLAYAQIMDLPDPGGGDTGSHTQVTPDQTTPQVQTQYAGLLRIGAVSRKTGGTLYKVDLATAARLQRLDVRVSANRVKIYSTTLVTTSGSRISVQQLSNTSVIATNAVVNSENITLNQNVAAIEISMESYDGEADIILTAVASSDVPKMTLRQEVKTEPQTPVVIKPTPSEPGDDSYNDDPYNQNNGSITYYGSAKFRPGMTVLLQCDRNCTNPNLWIARVEQNLGRGEIMISQNGEYLYVTADDLSASTNCYGSFCVDDRIAYGSTLGTITRIFENGTAAVRGQGSFFLTDVRYLKKAAEFEPAPRSSVQVLRCTPNNEFCVNDTVRYRGINVKIAEIYRDGRVLIRNPQNGYTATVSLREVIFVR